MAQVFYMNKGALHKGLFDSHIPNPSRMVEILDHINRLQLEAALLRRDQELSLLHEAQSIKQRITRTLGGSGGGRVLRELPGWSDDD